MKKSCFRLLFLSPLNCLGKQEGPSVLQPVLERITYGKMVSQTVFEFRHVVIAALSCVVRSVKSHSDIETQYEEIEVATNTQSGA